MIEAHYLTIDDCLGYVEIAGEGPPVLLVHTAGQSGVQWRRTTAALADRGYRVIVPDLPGHGRSEPAPGGPMTDLAAYARWLEHLLEAVRAREPRLVGCSIGGKIVLDLAARLGPAARAAVAMAAEPGPGAVNATGLRRELEDVAAPSRTDRTHLGTLAVVGQDVPQDRAELIARMHRREDPEVSTSDLLGWASHDLTDALSAITCPAKIVIGSDDLWIDPDRARSAAELMPNADCALLPGVGHYPMEEIDDFADVLHGWLQQLARTDADSPGASTTRPTTLDALLTDLVDRDPEAVIAVDAGAGEPVAVSRRDLRRRVGLLRADLHRRGVGAGDCAAVWLPNWSDALVWQLATASLGAHVIGVNTRYNVDELTHVLDRARPAVIAVAHDFHGLDLLGTLRAAVGRTASTTPSVAVIPGPRSAAPDEVSAYDLGAGAWSPSPDGDEGTTVPEADRQGQQLAVAFTTSGSTGAPKLAAHTEAAVVQHAFADAERADVQEGDVALCALPLSGVFGFNTAMAAIAGGASCLLEPVFADDTIVADMAAHRVTHVVAADDVLVRVQEAWRVRPRDLSAWRWAGIADFLGRSHEIAAWARDEFGTRTTGVYGSSEVFALTLLWPPEEPEPRRWAGGGRPVSPDIRVRTADPVTELPAADGERGELQIAGPTVVDAYLGDPEAAARSFTADGWFRTGDFAVLAEDGAVEYRGRIGDALRLRGFLVDPAEIERRLVEHAAVRTAKVVGIDGDDGSTIAIGYAVVEDGRHVTGEELREWCRSSLARFKVPGAIHLIDAMPTTSGVNGSKVHVPTLREWARQQQLETRR